MKQVFYGKNVNNQPVIAQSAVLKALMQSFGDEQFQITVEKRRKARSNNQNRFYNGCLIPAVIDALVDAGYARSELNRDIVHEFLKNKFLSKDIVSDQGEVMSVVRRTRDLTTEEFMIYIDDIARWGAEYLNTVFAMPNEQSILTF